MQRYADCPKSFWYQYVERAQGEDRPSPVLVTGNAVHAALDKFFGLPDEHRTEEVLHQALRSVWPSCRTEGAFDHVDEEVEAGQASLAMLSRYAQTHDLHARPREREGWARLRLPNGIQVFGKLDRIDQDDDGGLRVIDYKTGRRALTESEIPSNLAAQVYLLSVYEHFKPQRVTFELDYLALDRRLTWTPSNDELVAARQRLVAITDEIHGREDFKATPGDACSFCPYAGICDDKNRTTLDDIQITETVGF